MNDLDTTFADHILRSIHDTEYWFRVVLQTKVHGTDLAMTSQQLAFAKDFDRMYTAKKKKVGGFTLTDEEADLASMHGMSVQSGKCTGKTTVAAGLALKSLVCFKESVTLILGASYDQTKSTIWAEMNRLLQGSLIANDVHVGSERAHRTYDDKKKETSVSKYNFIELRATNVSENQQKQAKKFAGYHPPTAIFIFDEATGISRPVFSEVESTLGYVGGVNIMLVFFNPDVDVCYAADTQTVKRNSFLCHHWDAELTELNDEDWVRKRKEEYGEESPEYIRWVKGHYPPSSSDALIPRAWIQEAINRNLVIDKHEPLTFSYDAKGQGKCEAVLSCKQGGKLRWQKSNNIADTYEQADWIVDRMFEELDHHPASIAFQLLVETDGLGWGVFCDLKHHPSGMAKFTRPVCVGIKLRQSKGFRKYECVRDKIGSNMRQAFQDGVVQIPDERKLINQLMMMKFSTSTGKFKVQPKKELAESPDRYDSYAISFAKNIKRVYNKQSRSSSDRKYVKQKSQQAIGCGFLRG